MNTRSSAQKAPLDEPLTKAVGLLGAFVGIAYLVWRAGWTLNHDALWLSLPLLLAEVHGHGTYLLYLFTSWSIDPVPHEEPSGPRSVDIFIPTYNESLEVLSVTVAGALAVQWPHRTYVLDDGKRDWVRELCHQMGAEYQTREGNKGAKAGNINAALCRTNGDFIVIVDADFVPAPRMLHDTLGYFDDSTVAVVQGPQEFYNRDSFQHAGDGSDWHEQTTFYRVIQPGKNRWNAVFWCGSPSIVRRTALLEVGGVSTDTVTEDLHTSILLHRRGWRLVYHNGVIARGIAPENYHAFIIQRFRWAQGAMQVIRREWWRGGLTVPQRLSYISSTTTYFDAFRKLTLLLLIPMITLTDNKPVDFPMIPFLVGWFIYFGITQGANIVLGRGYYRWLNIEMFDLMKMFAFMQASVTLLAERTVKFRVTPKSEGGERYVHPLIAPLIAIIGLYVVGVVVGVMRLAGWLPTSQQTVTLGAIGWALALMTFLFVIAWRTYAHATHRSSHRLPFTTAGWMETDGLASLVQFSDLSLSGAGFTTGHEVHVGDSVVMSGRSRSIRIQATVVQVHPRGDSWFVGVAVTDSVQNRIELAKYVAAAVFAEDSQNPEPAAPIADRQRAA